MEITYIPLKQWTQKSHISQDREPILKLRATKTVNYSIEKVNHAVTEGSKTDSFLIYKAIKVYMTAGQMYCQFSLYIENTFH